MGSVELVQVSTDVLEPGQRTLGELADEVNRDIAGVQESAATALERAISAGRGLIAAKARVPNGEWIAWCTANIRTHHSWLRLYMRLARFEAELREARIEGLHEGVRYLTQIGAAGVHPGRPKPPAWMKRAARDMRANGVTWAVIAAELGASPATVARWANPEREARYRQACTDNRKRRYAAERALAQQERDQAIRRAVKKAGAATQEAWAMAERMQDVIAQAQRETEDREARNALSLAGEHYRRMRDQIVRALGVA